MNQVKQNNTDLLFIVFPYQYQMARNDEQSDSRLSAFMQNNDAEFIDMLPFYRNYSKNLYNKNDQIHPNVAGHRITANKISDYLSKKEDQD